MSTTTYMSEIKKQLISLRFDPQNVNEFGQTLAGTFPHILQSLQELTGDDQKERTVINDTLSIWFGRAMKFKSELESSVTDEGKAQFQIITELLGKLDTYTYIFQYTTDFWKDSNSPFANSLKSLFIKMCSFMKKCITDSNKWFMKWFLQCLNELDRKTKVRYFYLDNLIPLVDKIDDIEPLIFDEYKEDFVSEILELMSSNELAGSAGKTLSTILVQVYKKHNDANDIEAVNDYWFNQAMTYLEVMNAQHLKNIEAYFLAPTFKNCPIKVFKDFVEFAKDDVSLTLPLLKIGQEIGIAEEPFHGNSAEEKLIDINVVVNDLLQSSTYRIPAFELLTFSCKSSKPLQPYLYDIILSSLNNFFVDYEVSSRNYFNSVFKHFVYRIKDSTYNLNRTVQKLKLKNKFPDDQKEMINEIHNSKAFLENLLHLLKFQLTPNSQYQRILVSLRIIKTLLESGLDTRIDETYYDKKQRSTSWSFHMDVIDGTLLRLLYDNLTYSFEDVKKLCIEILSMLFNSSGFSSLENFNLDESLLINTGFKLLSFYSGCASGSKILEFLANVYYNNNDMNKLGSLIEELLKKLEAGIEMSSESYVKGLDFPIDGYFMTLSLILKNCPSKSYGSITERLLSAHERNWNNSFEILCFDSQEGVLPLEYTNSEVNDQVISSYAYRSVNEASSMLESLIGNRDYLLDKQLVHIGDLLITQLTSIRHSGAFQAVAPTFAVCCVAVNNRVPSRLMEWMKMIVESLENKTQHITRRSGGLPFLVGAILSAESPSSERPLLHYTFDNLLRMAKVSIVGYEDKLDLTQVHALNCMKGIFVESKLAEATTKYTNDALELCLRNFQSPLWSMRNCSIMLFTALQNKIFGKMSKNTSARQFFTKYHGIRELLLFQLENAVENQGSSVESIFLVLTIVSRLKQTPGFDGLNEFVPLLVKCLDSNIWKIREIAAKALPTVTEDKDALLQQLLSTLGIHPLGSQNRLHGYLCAMKELISTRFEVSFETKSQIYAQCAALVSINPCYSTANEYINLIKQFGIPKDQSVIPILSNYFVDHFSDPTWYGSKHLLMQNIAEYLLDFEEDENIKSVLLVALNSTSFEVQIIGISHVIDCNMLDNDIAQVLLEHLEDETTWSYIKSKVLIALQGSEISVPANLLVSMIESDVASDDLKSSALQSLGSFLTEEHESFYWELIDTYADDSLELPFRSAALKSLTNHAVSAKSLFHIALFLQDDDIDLRQMATKFLNEKYLNSEWADISNVAFKRFFQKFNVDNFAVTQEYLIKYIADLKFDFKSATAYEEGLFDSEQDNMIRNIAEMVADMTSGGAANIKDGETTLLQCLEKKTELLVRELSAFNTFDSAFGWGSDSQLFNEIAALLVLTNAFEQNCFNIIKTVLLEKNCRYIVDSLTVLL